MIIQSFDYRANAKYEILTDTGFQDFAGIKKTSSVENIIVYFLDNTSITVTRNHIFILESGCEIDAASLKTGDVITGKTIIRIEESNVEADVYDLIEVENGHRYLTADVLSHNCAFVEGWEEFQASTMPVISSGKETKIILVSTPNGLNHFYSIWSKAEEGKNNYNPIKVLWQDVPDRDEKWRQTTLADLNGDEEKFSQEFCVEFQGSSGTLISGTVLKSLVEKQPLSKVDGLCVFEQPQEDKTYSINCDVSRGKGLDYSTFSVIDISKMPYKQVCVYRNNLISPSEFAEVIFRIGNWYNQAAALVEINDIGGEVATLLADMEYENILYTENAGSKGKRIAINASKAERGVRTTISTKATGCSVLKLLIEQQQLIVQDYHTIYELSRFSRKGRSYEAEPGSHDDMVMTLVLFAWLTSQAYFKDLTDINTMALLRERTSAEIEEQMMLTGIFNDGVDFYETQESSISDVGAGEFDSWLAS